MLSPIFWLATKTGLSQAVIKWAGGALLIIAAIISFTLWINAGKRAAVNADRAAAASAATKAQLEAEHAADEKQQKAFEERAALAVKLEKGIDDAKRAHPLEAAKPSGPVTNATLDELRRRKASLR